MDSLQTSSDPRKKSVKKRKINKDIPVSTNRQKRQFVEEQLTIYDERKIRNLFENVFDAVEFSGRNILNKRERDEAELRDEYLVMLKEILDRFSPGSLSIIFSLVKSIEKLPEEKLKKVQKLVVEFAEKASTLELPDTIPEEKKYKSGDVMEYLEKEWGDYLTYFGAEKDILFQNYFRQHQPTYMKKLYNKLYYAHNRDPLNNPKPEDVIKRLTDHISEKAQACSDEEAKELKSIVSSKYYKKTKTGRSSTPEIQ